MLIFEYEDLSEPDSVLLWFQDPCYDLETLGHSPGEKEFLRVIDRVANESGATNFWLALYVLKLEDRLLKNKADLEGLRLRISTLEDKRRWKKN